MSPEVKVEYSVKVSNTYPSDGPSAAKAAAGIMLTVISIARITVRDLWNRPFSFLSFASNIFVTPFYLKNSKIRLLKSFASS